MLLSTEIKIANIYYWIKRQFPYVASEVYSVGNSIADIMIADDKKIMEIEIKISRNDFKCDFKKHKHQLLDSGSSPISNFYFCVPEEMREFALNELKDSKYGLLVYNSNVKFWPDKSITVSKRPQNLIINKRQAYFRKRIISRMGWELFRCYLKEYRRGNDEC